MTKDFMKYPKIKAIGDEDIKTIFDDAGDIIIVEEKVDGGNFRVYIKDGNLVFGSRNCELAPETGGNFSLAIKYLSERLLGKDLTALEGKILYGELMVKHSIHYDFENIPRFIGYDIYDMKTNTFLNYMDKVELFLQYHIPTIKVVGTYTAKECKALKLDDSFVPKSAYGDIKAEGVVFKNYDKQLFGKFVTTQFKEVNKGTFGGGKKLANDDTELISAMYCTNARIDKQFFSLVDSGKKPHLSMMSELPMMVYKDIMDEHAKDICMTKYTIDFHRLRKHISNRCLKVLQQLITNQALVDGVTSDGPKN